MIVLLDNVNVFPSIFSIIKEKIYWILNITIDIPTTTTIAIAILGILYFPVVFVIIKITNITQLPTIAVAENIK